VLAWILLAVLIAAVAVTPAAAILMSRRRLALRRRVLVNLVGGKAISGVLWARRGPLLVLKDATLHEPGVQPVPVDGEVIVDRVRVDFVQVLPQ